MNEETEVKERIELLIAIPYDQIDRECPVFCYANNGEFERMRLRLDEKDFDNNYYTFILPKNTLNVSMSYIQGLFRKSVGNILATPDFKDKYQFKDDNSAAYNFEREIDNMYTEVFFDSMRESGKNQTVKEAEKKIKKLSGGFYIALYLCISSAIALSVSMSIKNIVLAATQIPLAILGVVAAILFIIDAVRGKES